METLILPALLLAFLFWSLRQMETWLHRHIFKVGWLLTKRFETTTVFYYTFFLPGVFLNQFTVWLMAGVLDVRAKSAIVYPAEQEIGELRLNFVRISEKAPPLKAAMIHLSPLIVGLLVVYLVDVNIFNMREILQIINEPQGGLFAGLQTLFTRPDFWLVSYITFTVANTMMPQRGSLKGFAPVLAGFVALAALVIVAGFGDELGAALVDPLLSAMNGMSLLFGMVIVVDILATAVLALIENSIELVTGDSATFRNGKLVAVRRKDLIAQRAAEREKERKKREQREQRKQTPAPALPASSSGTPSIYRFALPVPDAPDMPPRVSILEKQTPLFELDRPRPAVPKVIDADVDIRTLDDEENAEPTPKPSVAPLILEDDDESGFVFDGAGVPDSKRRYVDNTDDGYLDEYNDSPFSDDYDEDAPAADESDDSRVPLD